MFDRWQAADGRTWAYRLFKQHHSEINSLYWSHTLAANRTLNLVKKADKRLKPAAFFSVPRKYLQRTAPTLERWEKDYKDFNNWVRLSASVAIHAYMEIYFKKISALAVESNPGLIIGAPGAIDGVALLKSRPGYNYSEYAVHFVKGDWNTRIQHYERLFGKAPATLRRYAKELNELRKMRNGVGHSFGRSVDEYDTELQIGAKPMMRLSEERFGGWLNMADEVASAIDDHLKAEHIGQYEMLLYYHLWRGKMPDNRKKEAEAFRQALEAELGERVDIEYCRGLIEYYETC